MASHPALGHGYHNGFKLQWENLIHKEIWQSFLADSLTGENIYAEPVVQLNHCWVWRVVHEGKEYALKRVILTSRPFERWVRFFFLRLA